MYCSFCGQLSSPDSLFFSSCTCSSASDLLSCSFLRLCCTTPVAPEEIEAHITTAVTATYKYVCTFVGSCYKQALSPSVTATCTMIMLWPLLWCLQGESLEMRLAVSNLMHRTLSTCTCRNVYLKICTTVRQDSWSYMQDCIHEKLLNSQWKYTARQTCVVQSPYTVHVYVDLCTCCSHCMYRAGGKESYVARVIVLRRKREAWEGDNVGMEVHLEGEKVIMKVEMDC